MGIVLSCDKQLQIFGPYLCKSYKRGHIFTKIQTPATSRCPQDAKSGDSWEIASHFQGSPTIWGVNMRTSISTGLKIFRQNIITSDFLSMNMSAGNKVKLEIIFRFLPHSNPVTVRSCWKSVSTSPGQSASFNCHPPITLSLIGIAFQLGNISERTRLKLLSLLCKKNIPCRSKSYICSIWGTRWDHIEGVRSDSV